jgi:hypothetical protein
MNIKYGIIAVDENGNDVHFCGYEVPITIAHILSLQEELKTDEELGLIGHDLSFRVATEEEVAQYKIPIDKLPDV